MRIALAIVVLWAGSAVAQQGQEKPPLPYYDWGACPFECCTYREWEAVKPVTAFKTRSARSSAAFQIKKGQRVQGVTGVVVTTKYGITRILKPVQIGYTSPGKSPELSLSPGDVVYTLHYQGEASDLFWYHGKTYSDQISVPENAWGNVPYHEVLRVESRPKYAWWVKVKNRQGMVGWSKETEAFAHMDSCE